MRQATVVRSWTALAVGTACAGGTLYVLSEDVVKGGPVTTDHVLSVLVLGVLIYAGHHVLSAFRDLRLLSAFGLLALFLAGTVLLVTKAAGRNAEAQMAKTLAAAQDNAELTRLQKELAEAKAHRDRWIALTANECASGRGKNCLANEKTRDAAEAAYEKAEKKLRGAPVARVENGGIRYAARAAKVLLGLNMEQAAIEQWLELFLPLGTTLVLEFGTAVLFGYGLGHARKRSIVANDNPPPGRGDEVIDWVRAYHARHGRLPQIPEVQRRFGLSKTTAWRRIRAA